MRIAAAWLKPHNHTILAEALEKWPRGDPYDNAVAENFFSCLKCELIHLKHYPTRAMAQADVFAYLETFYNTVRHHSALGWVSPAQFEAYLLASAA